jgi:hypothetical protein
MHPEEVVYPLVGLQGVKELLRDGEILSLVISALRVRLVGDPPAELVLRSAPHDLVFRLWN